MIELVKQNYVVLDVETNGLNSNEYDLLSISIYDPFTNDIYNRFLPLDLNKDVYTTYINGITKDMLENKLHITQEEFNDLIRKYDLANKKILTFGSIDEKFIKSYCKRNNIEGFEKLHFFNFKHNIISSRFSTGNITKDNLCRLYGIENVKNIHSGENDCILEWKLFEKIYNKFLLITKNNVFELNDNYIIPVSYLETYSNFKYYREIPKVYISTKVIKKFALDKKKIVRFETNVSGVSIEHLINTMLEVTKINNLDYELQNKSALKFIGRLPSLVHEIPVLFNTDGTITALKQEDDKYIESVNKTTKQLQKQLEPLIDYIKTKIFKKSEIFSQELIINTEDNILCKCDLSNRNAVLEIKTGNNLDFDKIKLQLFYESNQRPVYVLHMDWYKLQLIISKVEFISSEEYEKIKYNNKIMKSTREFQRKIGYKNIKVIEYINSNTDIKLKCKKCGLEWITNYKQIRKEPTCPCCTGKTVKNDINLTKKIKEKIFLKSNGNIMILKQEEKDLIIEVGCLKCNHEWKTKADVLLENCICPNCDTISNSNNNN